MNDKIYIGQIGVLFEVSIKSASDPYVDWSNAHTVQLVFQKPDKTTMKVPAVLGSTALKFTTTSCEQLDQPGTYLVQAHLAGPGYDALGATDSFIIHKPFN